ncbi:MAG: hypothetical protein AB8G23_04825 [Myxococcota bacterium]
MQAPASTQRTGLTEGWSLLGLLTLGILGMTAVVLGLNGTGELGVRALIRATARSSLLLFCAAYSASALLRFWPRPATRWLVRNRRGVGLGFAVSHTVHYAAVYAVSQINPEQFFDREGRSLTDVVTVGPVLMLLAMVVLSFDRTQAWVGRRGWQSVHWVMSLGFWLAFTASYGGRTVEDSAYLPPALLLLATMGLRIAAFIAKRAPR